MSTTTTTYTKRKPRKKSANGATATNGATSAKGPKLLSSLTARGIREAIDNGKTIPDLCEEYDCTSEELDLVIKRLYPQEFSREKISRGFKKNGKKRKDGKTSATPASTPVPKKTEAMTSEAEPAAANESTPDTSTEQETAQAEVAETTETTQEADKSLEELQTLEKQLTDSIIDTENRHKAAWQKHHAHGEAIKAIYGKIEEIQKQLAGLTAEYQQELAGARQCEEEMSAATAERNVELAKREEVRASIAKAKKLTIMVYATGEFEELNHNEVDFSGHNEIYLEIRDDSRLEEARIKDVKILAMVLAAERNHKDREIEFSFENPDVEIAYLYYKDE